jgi:hypothetical protein
MRIFLAVDWNICRHPEGWACQGHVQAAVHTARLLRTIMHAAFLLSRLLRWASVPRSFLQLPIEAPI